MVARFTWSSRKFSPATETLRKDWPVHGTTGYDFANQVTQLLVDSSAETAITKTFHRFIGHSMHFGHLVYAKKRLVMRLALANDVNVLGNMVDRLSEQNRWFRDFTSKRSPAPCARRSPVSRFIAPISRRAGR